MEGPTPVSALIHAATMVTAGVYMIVRNHAIFDLSPFAMSMVAFVGGGTALFAATIGLGPDRHQTRFGLFDGEPARVYVSRLRDRRLYGGCFSCHDPCVLQSVVVPGGRVCDPCIIGGTGYPKDGRTEQPNSVDPSVCF